MGRKPKTYDRLRMNSGQHRRIRLVMLFFGVLAFVPVLWRMYDLMVSNYDVYSALALRNQTRSTTVAAERGDICDRNMNILATSVNVEHVYLNPHELKQSGADVQELSRVLGEILQKDPGWIAEQAVDRKQRYKQIGSGIPEETAAKIREYINSREVSGIHLEPATRRYYPFGSLAAQVIGFTNASNDGSEGIEASYDRYLSGKTGRVITSKGNNEMDMPFSYEKYISSRQGNTVILTLDATVQSCLEKQLQAAMERYAVKNGAFGLVMNAKTGEILAMATLGSYDPNQYLEVTDSRENARLELLKESYLSCPEGSEDWISGRTAYTEALSAARLKQWRNRVLSDGYEPDLSSCVLRWPCC